jgi:hypothetical protein
MLRASVYTTQPHVAPPRGCMHAWVRVCLRVCACKCMRVCVRCICKCVRVHVCVSAGEVGGVRSRVGAAAGGGVLGVAGRAERQVRVRAPYARLVARVCMDGCMCVRARTS